MFRGSCRIHAVMLAAGLMMAGWGAPVSAADSPEDIRAEMRRLQSKLDQLEARQAQTSETIQKMIDDAARRSQLLSIGEGANVSYDPARGGFYIQDGPNVVHPFAMLQFRNNITSRDNAGPAGESSWENGFEVRRMKFGFDGTLFTTDLSYLFQWGVGRKDGLPVMEDAWAKYKFADNWAIRAGQFKDPLTHESWIGAKKLLATDRSYMNDYFTNGDNYTQGVSLIWEPKARALRGELAITDGQMSANQNYRDFPTNSYSFGVTGRMEWAVFGDFKGYDEFTAIGVQKDSLVIGVAADYSQAGDTSPLTHTIDVMFKNTAGLSLYGAYIGRWIENSAGGGSSYDWGAEAQVAYAFNPRWEVFGRYDYLSIDSVAATPSSVNEFTVGVNRYFNKHNVKLTVDLSYLPDGAPVSLDGLGIMATDGDVWVLRTQFQLAI